MKMKMYALFITSYHPGAIGPAYVSINEYGEFETVRHSKNAKLFATYGEVEKFGLDWLNPNTNEIPLNSLHLFWREHPINKHIVIKKI